MIIYTRDNFINLLLILTLYIPFYSTSLQVVTKNRRRKPKKTFFHGLLQIQGQQYPQKEVTNPSFVTLQPVTGKPAPAPPAATPANQTKPNETKRSRFPQGPNLLLAFPPVHLPPSAAAAAFVLRRLLPGGGAGRGGAGVRGFSISSRRWPRGEVTA